ncbi:hypothetical protein ES703_45580 [subsurface metagenome]
MFEGLGFQKFNLSGFCTLRQVFQQVVDCSFDRDGLNIDALTVADLLPHPEDLVPVHPVGVYCGVDMSVPVPGSAGDFDYVCTAEYAVFPVLCLS